MFHITLIRCSHGLPYECRCDRCVEEGVERERLRLEDLPDTKPLSKLDEKEKPAS